MTRALTPATVAGSVALTSKRNAFEGLGVATVVEVRPARQARLRQAESRCRVLHRNEPRRLGLGPSAP
jgi:hypothetical protein